MCYLQLTPPTSGACESGLAARIECSHCQFRQAIGQLSSLCWELFNLSPFGCKIMKGSCGNLLKLPKLQRVFFYSQFQIMTLGQAQHLAGNCILLNLQTMDG